MKIATAAYPLDWFNRWNEYVGKIRVWVRNAAEQGAELLVFPEYGALELASLAQDTGIVDLPTSLSAVDARLADVDELHASLAREFNVHICAASAPVQVDDGSWRNRARLFSPDGSVGVQEKLVMTRFEREQWGVSGAQTARVFETVLGKIGIAICYDSEFPLVARAMVEAGATILLVPSCTDTAHGYNRVRVGAMARALEGQCVVVHAVTVGDVPWLPAADTNFGAAAVYGPPDGDFPETGIIAMGKPNSPGWVYADIDVGMVEQVRETGAVFNHRHWPEQTGLRVETQSFDRLETV